MNKGKEGESLWHSEHLPEYLCCSCSLETMCSRAAAKLSCLLLHRFEKHRKAKPFRGTWALFIRSDHRSHLIIRTQRSILVLKHGISCSMCNGTWKIMEDEKWKLMNMTTRCFYYNLWCTVLSIIIYYTV